MREVQDAAAQRLQAACQNRMVVRRGQHLVDQRHRKDADADGGAARDAGREYPERVVDLLNSNQCDRGAAERRCISAIAVEHPDDVDAKANPNAEHREQETVGLGKHAGDRDRCRHADAGCKQPVTGLFHALTARGQCQDRYREG
ncbi:hypothetical protein ACVWWG_007146 [Bradyrhizobium sp. LB7.2]